MHLNVMETFMLCKCIWFVNIFSARKVYIYVMQCLKADSPTSLQGLNRPDVSAAVSINLKTKVATGLVFVYLHKEMVIWLCK